MTARLQPLPLAASTVLVTVPAPAAVTWPVQPARRNHARTARQSALTPPPACATAPASAPPLRRRTAVRPIDARQSNAARPAPARRTARQAPTAQARRASPKRPTRTSARRTPNASPAPAAVVVAPRDVPALNRRLG